MTNLFFDGLTASQHGHYVFKQIFAFKVMGKAVDSPAHILGKKVENPPDLRRKFADAEIPIDEDRGDIGAVQQIIHVISELGQLADLFLVFRVDGIELFIHRVQFFVGALQFFIAGDELFVARLEFFVAGFEFFDRGLEVFPRVTQFGFDGDEMFARGLG